MPRISIPSYNSEPLAYNNGFITRVWARFFEQVWARIGGGGLFSLGGNLSINTTEVGNVGTGIDNLITYNLSANTLNKTGDCLEIKASGTFAANANNKRVRLLLGSTLLFDTGVIAANNSHWSINAQIIRKGATSQDIIACFNGNNSLVTNTATYTSGTEDLTTLLTIKCTGEATNNNDVLQKNLIIRFFPYA